MNNEQRGFIKEIMMDPDNKVSKLIYADYLEDVLNLSKHAWMIRLMVNCYWVKSHKYGISKTYYQSLFSEIKIVWGVVHNQEYMNTKQRYTWLLYGGSPSQYRPFISGRCNDPSSGKYRIMKELLIHHNYKNKGKGNPRCHCESLWMVKERLDKLVVENNKISTQ